MIDVAKMLEFLNRTCPGCDISHYPRDDEYFNRRVFLVRESGDARAFLDASLMAGRMFVEGLADDYTASVNVFRVEMSKSFGETLIRIHCREREPK